LIAFSIPKGLRKLREKSDFAPLFHNFVEKSDFAPLFHNFVEKIDFVRYGGKAPSHYFVLLLPPGEGPPFPPHGGKAPVAPYTLLREDLDFASLKPFSKG